MSGEDWRGADKISAKGRSRGERETDTRAIASRLAHARRQAKGCNMAKAGGLWARQIRAWHLSGKLKGSE